MEIIKMTKEEIAKDFMGHTHKIVGDFFGKDIGGIMDTEDRCKEKLHLLNLVTENPYDGKCAPILRAMEKVKAVRGSEIT